MYVTLSHFLLSITTTIRVDAGNRKMMKSTEKKNVGVFSLQISFSDNSRKYCTSYDVSIYISHVQFIIVYMHCL